MAVFQEQSAFPKMPQGNIMPEEHDPESLEQELLDRPDPMDQPAVAPQKVMVADASGNVPMPTRAPNKAAEQPSPVLPPEQPFGLVPKDDSRYQDYQQILFADVVLQGALPWLQAGVDIATGRVSPDDFDKVRMDHQHRIESLRQENPEFVQAAEKALPFLSGLGLGIMGGKAGSVMGAAGRGMSAGAAMGAVQGYTSGPIEEPSDSSERVGRAVGQAAESGAIGAAGGAIAKGVQKGVGAAQDAVAARATQRQTEAAERQAQQQAQQRSQRAQQAAKKRQLAKDEAANEERQAGAYEQYTRNPKQFSKHYKENRQEFAKDPESVFRQVAEFQPTMEAFSATLNMPASVIVQRMIPRMRNIQPQTPAERNLYNEMRAVYDSRQAAMRRGISSGEPARPNAGRSGAKPAAKAAPVSPRVPAGAKRAFDKSEATRSRKPGDEPIRQFNKSGRDKQSRIESRKPASAFG